MMGKWTGGASVLAVSARAGSSEEEEEGGDCARDNTPEGLSCWGVLPGATVDRQEQLQAIVEELEPILLFGGGTVSNSDPGRLAGILREAQSELLDPEGGMLDSLYTCWKDGTVLGLPGSSSAFPLGMLRRNLTDAQDGGTGTDPGNDETGPSLWRMPAFWQVSTDPPTAVVLGTVLPLFSGTNEPSSILTDGARSDLNRILAEVWIPALSVRGPINLLAVDDVCAYGPEMLVALRTDHDASASFPPTLSPTDAAAEAAPLEEETEGSGVATTTPTPVPTTLPTPITTATLSKGSVGDGGSAETDPTPSPSSAATEDGTGTTTIAPTTIAPTHGTSSAGAALSLASMRTCLLLGIGAVIG